ncbi:MAG: hypothetical protein SGI86_06020 [Deltaproteobacteria bacterium]|nr:hypothetical protein [Deltaproteobacteria bacterium]
MDDATSTAGFGLVLLIARCRYDLDSLRGGANVGDADVYGGGSDAGAGSGAAAVDAAFAFDGALVGGVGGNAIGGSGGIGPGGLGGIPVGGMVGSGEIVQASGGMVILAMRN